MLDLCFLPFRLKAHAADPSISNLVPRQFVLFLCPVGDFADQLNKFWEDSFKQYGRNAVHNSFPHITLTSFFQVGFCFIGRSSMNVVAYKITSLFVVTPSDEIMPD